MITFSVVVCTTGRAEALERCLRALRLGDAEVIVVHNAREASTNITSMVKHLGCEYLWEPKGALSTARNTGWARARGDAVAFVDDDSVPAPDWQMKITTAFLQGDYDIVTGRILPLDPSKEVMELLQNLDRTDPGGESFEVSREMDSWFERVLFGPVGNGSNMAFRKTAMLQWRGFDPRFGRGALVPGGEENIAFTECVSAGHKLKYLPDAVVYHPIPDSEQDLVETYLKSLSSAVVFNLCMSLRWPSFAKAIASRWRRRVTEDVSRSGQPSTLKIGTTTKVWWRLKGIIHFIATMLKFIFSSKLRRGPAFRPTAEFERLGFRHRTAAYVRSLF